jgi:hypothetical protein
MPEAIPADAIPVRQHDYEQHPDGLVTVLVPKFTSALARRLLVPLLRRPHIRMHLDAVGSAAWLAMDGRASVAGLVSLVRERFGGTEEDAARRVTLFLRQLGREGSIILVVSTEATTG